MTYDSREQFMAAIPKLFAVLSLLCIKHTICEQYYIVPSPSTPCPNATDTCMTLNQYAANASQYYHMNTSLILMQGTHSLNTELSISNVTEISILGEQPGDQVTITCLSSGRLMVTEVDYLHIKMLRFQQCSDNQISSVGEFLLEESVFARGTSTALELRETSGLIRNVHITNISLPTQGGAILCQHCMVQVNNSVLERNSARVGGAIYAQSESNVAIMDSTFFLNYAVVGGALYADGDSNITVHSCSFRANGFLAISSLGGALALSQSVATIVNSTFEGHQAIFGSVISARMQSDVSIRNCSFTDNFAEIGGVLFGNDESTCGIEFSLFTDNSANMRGGALFLNDGCNLTINASTFEGSSAAQGGAIGALSGNISITNSIFRNSTVTSREGGVIYAEAHNIIIRNSSFHFNTCPVGGVVYATTNSTLTVQSCEFSNNGMFQDLKDISLGGVFVIHQSKAEINDSTFFSNRANSGGALYAQSDSNITVRSSRFIANAHNGISQGGALSLLQSIMMVVSCTFQENEAAYGAAVDVQQDADVIIHNSSFIRNNAHILGGAIFGDTSSFNVEHSMFDGNTATLQGGTFFLAHSNLTINTSTFEGGNARRGGVIETQLTSNISIANSVFQNNMAFEQGGVFTAIKGEIEITDSNFINNSALSGGVLYFDGTASQIMNSSFSDNYGQRSGGVLINVNGSIDIQMCEFTRNRATINGGVLFMTSSTIELSMNTFHSNEADFFSGVAFIGSCSLTDLNNTYFNNSAFYGGALYTERSVITIEESSFSDNKGNYVGGAIATVTHIGTNIVNCVFVRNTVDSFGGALFLQSASLLDTAVTGSRFLHNQGHLGGAVSVVDGAFIELNTNMFYNNSATAMGGAIYTSNTNVSLHDSSFNNNKADISGGAVVTFGSGLNSFSDLTVMQNLGNAGIITLFESDTNCDGSNLFKDNLGSFTAIASNVRFYGSSTFTNCVAPNITNIDLPIEQGGAITLFRSRLNLYGMFTLMNNRAENGAGIHATESSFQIFGNASVVNNIAEIAGGGAYLYQSEFTVFGKCRVDKNSAGSYGGGIYSIGSSITTSTTAPSTESPVSSQLILNKNKARLGGAVYLSAL